jgi:hypothetical protein
MKSKESRNSALKSGHSRRISMAGEVARMDESRTWDGLQQLLEIDLDVIGLWLSTGNPQLIQPRVVFPIIKQPLHLRPFRLVTEPNGLHRP